MPVNSPLPLEGRDLATVSESEIIQAAESGLLISQQGTKVIKIAKNAVVKIGFEVSQGEASTMEYVSNHFQGNIRAPQVRRCFSLEGLGYLVMEFANGETLDRKPWSTRTYQEQRLIIDLVRQALSSMRAMQSSRPGPVGGGIPIGGLFTIYGAGRPLETTTELELWINKKLQICNAGDVTGKFNDLSMCHMDLSLRNLLLDEAGQLWVLDWAHAGFFPPVFEYTSLLSKEMDDPDYDFAQAVLHEDDHKLCDETLSGLLLHVYRLNSGPFAGSHLIE